MAEALYRQVLERQPRNFDALHFLGLLLHGKSDNASKQEGMQLVQKSLKLSPGNQNFLNNLATLYIDSSDWDNALKLCLQIVSHRPSFAGGHYNLGCVYRNLGDYPQAETCFLTAIHQGPKIANSYAGLALVYYLQRRFETAGKQYQLALELDENCYDALAGMGQLFISSAQFGDADRCLSRAIALRPMVAENYAKLAFVFNELGQSFEALRTLETAAKIDSNNHYCRLALILSYTNLGRYAEADQQFALSKQTGILPAVVFSNYAMRKQYDPAATPEQLFDLHCEFGRLFEPAQASKPPVFIRDQDQSRRLKIGYVSGDFRAHAVAFFILPILKEHDHENYEIHCYSTFGVVDATTQTVIACCDHWHPIFELTPQQIHDKIRADEIDILIDLSGHTAHNILDTLAQRLAPIQATWIGYPGTTGLSAMDYRITDANLDPIGLTDQFHTEKLLRLPCTNAVFSPHAESPDVSELPALKNGYMTFACLNMSQKLNAAVIACWASILKALPSAKLILCDTGDPEVANKFITMFALHGIPSTQIQTKPRMSIPLFLALHAEVDLALDPFPYNGGTTNCHALWMGVPMITWPGRTTVSNVGAAVLRPLGLDEFIVSSADEYIETAIALSKNLPHLSAIRQGLRDRVRQAGGTQPGEVTLALERAYREIWRTWCLGQQSK